MHYALQSAGNWRDFMSATRMRSYGVMSFRKTIALLSMKFSMNCA
jgi:hypothetical protein